MPLEVVVYISLKVELLAGELGTSWEWAGNQPLKWGLENELPVGHDWSPCGRWGVDRRIRGIHHFFPLKGEDLTDGFIPLLRSSWQVVITFHFFSCVPIRLDYVHWIISIYNWSNASQYKLNVILSFDSGCIAESRQRYN